MEEKVYEILKKLNIEYEKVTHPALFTEKDDEKYGIVFNGTTCKNLFIRNKNKSKYYLIIIPLNKRINLNELQEKLNETRLSFGSEETLFEKLKITSGSVSLLNIIEVEQTDVKFIIDSNLLKENKVGFHPNTNKATVLFSPQNIEKIMDFYNVNYEFIAI